MLNLIKRFSLTMFLVSVLTQTTFAQTSTSTQESEILKTEPLYAKITAGSLHSDHFARNDPRFNNGKAMVFVTGTKPLKAFNLFESYMDERRGITAGLVPGLIVISVTDQGRYSSPDSGSWNTNSFLDVTSMSTRDIAFGKKLPNDQREIFVAGEASVKRDKKTENWIVVARNFTGKDPAQRHFFGEDGIVLIAPSQIDSKSTKLHLRKLFALEDGTLRLLIESVVFDQNSQQNIHALSMMALNENGLPIPDFGANGLKILDPNFDASGKPFNLKSRLHVDRFYQDDHTDFFLTKYNYGFGRGAIEVQKYNIVDGLLDANFTPISMRTEAGIPTSYHFTSIDAAPVVVAEFTRTDRSKFMLIGKFDASGLPQLNFSGDGKRIVPSLADSVNTTHVLAAPNDVLYVVGFLANSSGHSIILSRHFLDDVNQGARDRTFGIDGTFQLNSSNTSFSDGTTVGNKRLILSTSSIFLEILANNKHNIVLTGSAGLAP